MTESNSVSQLDVEVRVNFEVIKILPFDIEIELSSFDRFHQQIDPLSLVFFYYSFQRLDFYVALLILWCYYFKTTVMVPLVYQLQLSA